MVDNNRVHEVLIEICELVSPKRNGGFNARCPICGDSKKNKSLKRLHVDWYPKYDSWICTCFNGGCSYRSGNIYSLYAEAKGMSFGEAKEYIDQSRYDTEEIKRRLSTSSRSVSADTPVPSDDRNPLDIDIDNECLSVHAVTDDRILSRYIVVLKKFMSERMIPHECYIAYTGRYKGRIIIPIYNNGRLVYFQGRSISKSIEPKYLNPVVDKSNIIMNVDKFDRSKSIIITEGIIDAWMVEGNQGTTVLGGHFDDDLIAKLIGMTDGNVILCFDNPLVDNAGKSEITNFIHNSDFKNRVRYFLPYRRDFKDLNDLRLIHDGSIYDYVVENSFSLLNVVVKLSMKL